MRSVIHSALLLIFVSEFALAQSGQRSVADRTPQIRQSDGTFLSRLVSPYSPREVSPVNFQNSQRIFNLMRAGQFYLSLHDAIALALENNLDIQLERFLPTISHTDILRPHGGGLPRGLTPLSTKPTPHTAPPH